MLDFEKYPKLYGENELNFGLTEASILITEDCNLRCTYCFEKHNKNKMSESTADKAVDFLFDNAIRTNRNHCGFTMFGGEPMMAPDIFERMARRAWKKSEETGITVSFSVITNGTFLPDNIANLMKEGLQKNKPIAVQISFDGTPEVQDRYRVTASGGPSSHMVIKTLEKYREVYGRFFSELVSIHGVMNADTVSKMFDSFKYFREDLGFLRTWFLPVTEENWTDEHVKIYFEQMGLIKEYIMNIVRKTGQLIEIQGNAPLDRCLNDGRESMNIPCGAGRNYCSITANGEVYPCHNIYFNDPNKDTILGNLWTGINKNAVRVYQEYEPSDISNCSGCNHGYCYRCIAISFSENGTLFSQVRGNYCKMMKIDKYFQDQILKEITEMGLIGNGKGRDRYERLTSEQAGFECGEVYEDYGKCHWVDLTSKEWNLVKDLPDNVYPENWVEPKLIPYIRKEENIIETFSKDGKTFERIVQIDGTIKTNEIQKEDENIYNEESCCGSCKNSDFEDIVVESLTMIINKINEIERNLNKK